MPVRAPQASDISNNCEGGPVGLGGVWGRWAGDMCNSGVLM